MADRWKVVNYVIVTGNSTDAVAIEVLRLIAADVGWEPVGGVSVAFGQHGVTWAQGMVRREEIDAEENP